MTIPYDPLETTQYSACCLCHRRCGVDRLHGAAGYCGQTAQLTAARAALHFWEEPCISGVEGSGAVFFGGCSLRCVFCQNHNIALGNDAIPLTADRLSDIFLELQDQNANNINLVTGTQFIPTIVRALEQAKQHGLSIPIVYNTGSYETVEALRMLEGLIDIYLPDLKYRSSELSARFSNAGNYFDIASSAITEMVRQTGEPVFSSISHQTSSEASLLKRGVIVRHLVLPGHTRDSKEVLQYLSGTYGNRIYISLMGQYTPMADIASRCEYPELRRRLTRREYDKVVNYALSLGLEQVYIQDLKTASESFIPAFDFTGI